MKAAAYGHGESPYCCFHPREVIVGVCAHCLKDRLLRLLAGAGDAANNQHRTRGRSRSGSISLPKVFALGSSFLQRLDSRHHRPGDNPDSDGGGTTSGSSLDDSFISIKFEDNGKAMWGSSDNNKQPQPASPPPARSSKTVVVAPEHVKRGGVTRWRKHVVGRLLQLARWKRSSPEGNGNGNGRKERPIINSKKAKKAARGGGGWIRTLTLTRRRAGDLHRPSWSSS